jgi:hypothetical protein
MIYHDEKSGGGVVLSWFIILYHWQSMVQNPILSFKSWVSLLSSVILARIAQKLCRKGGFLGLGRAEQG